MAETIILSQQDLAFVDANLGGLYIWQSIPAVFSLVEGESYIVEWNGEQHNCVAISGSFSGMDGVGIGNFALAGIGADTNEPFLFGMPVDGGFSACYTTENKATNRVAIYLITEGTKSPYDIVLKTWDGSEVVHNAPNGIEVLLPDGNTQRYIPGEPEETTVALDFSTGDMEVVPSKGKLLTKVSIPRPTNLLPTNIAKDVEIAGIVGTHEGGGNIDEAYVSYTLDGDGCATAASMNGFSVIPNACFYNMYRLETVDISNSPNLTSICANAFNSCSKLTDFDIPQSVTYIGNYAFYGCKALKSITIPGSAIKSYAFQNCTGLESVVIEEGTPYIGHDADNDSYCFAGCTSLKTITIPSTVNEIAWCAFYNCSALESAVFANPNGWYWTKTKGATSGTAVDMSDPATAATALKTNYNCYWYRK